MIQIFFFFPQEVFWRKKSYWLRLWNFLNTYELRPISWKFQLSCFWGGGGESWRIRENMFKKRNSVIFCWKKNWNKHVSKSSRVYYWILCFWNGFICYLQLLFWLIWTRGSKKVFFTALVVYFYFFPCDFVIIINFAVYHFKNFKIFSFSEELKAFPSDTLMCVLLLQSFSL